MSASHPAHAVHDETASRRPAAPAVCGVDAQPPRRKTQSALAMFGHRESRPVREVG